MKFIQITTILVTAIVLPDAFGKRLGTPSIIDERHHRALSVTPSELVKELALYESTSVDKDITTPEIPPVLEMCLLEDETGSFADDIHNLKNAKQAIYDDIVDKTSSAKFAVTGFRDYAVSPHGSPGDWVYRVLSSMNSAEQAWLNGVDSLTAGGGADGPEAQYDAIVLAAKGGNSGNPPHCGWTNDPQAARVLVVTTDAPFHLPGSGKPHQNNLATTTAALNSESITVVGLKAPGTGSELDQLAAATGGTTQPLTSSGSNIAQAILAGLSNLPIKVVPTPVGCTGLAFTFTPPHVTVTTGDTAEFEEKVQVVDPNVAGTVVTCKVNFLNDQGVELGSQDIEITVPLDLEATPGTATNELGIVLSHEVVATVTSGGSPIPNALVSFEVTAGPNTGKAGNSNTNAAGQTTFTYNGQQGPAGAGTDTIKICCRGVCDEVEKVWQDTTDPIADCDSSVNPGGQEPPAGQKNKHQNPDGFYVIAGEDLVDPNPTIMVKDDGSGEMFGPFPSGTNIKYTQAPGGKPNMREGNGEVDYFIKGKGDALVVVTDFAGNEDTASCLVPPSPS